MSSNAQEEHGEYGGDDMHGEHDLHDDNDLDRLEEVERDVETLVERMQAVERRAHLVDREFGFVNPTEEELEEYGTPLIHRMQNAEDRMQSAEDRLQQLEEHVGFYDESDEEDESGSDEEDESGSYQEDSDQSGSYQEDSDQEDGQGGPLGALGKLVGGMFSNNEHTDDIQARIKW